MFTYTIEIHDEHGRRTLDRETGETEVKDIKQVETVMAKEEFMRMAGKAWERMHGATS